MRQLEQPKVITKIGIDQPSVTERTTHKLYDVELYLSSESIKGESTMKGLIENVKKNVITVHSVHTPDSTTTRHKNLFISPFTALTGDSSNITKTFVFANKIGSIQGNQVTVVVHNDAFIPIPKICPIGELDREVKDTLFTSLAFTAELLRLYPNTIMVLENITPYSYGNITPGYGYGDEAIRYIEWFEIYCGMTQQTYLLDRIGTLIDTCHVLATIRRLKQKSSITPKELRKDFNRYIRSHKGYLKQIHLANLVGYGDTKQTHGVSFSDTEDNIEMLKMIYKAFNSIGFNGIVTLEIAESIYPSSVYVYETLCTLYAHRKEFPKWTQYYMCSNN